MTDLDNRPLRIFWPVSKLAPTGGIGRVVWAATAALAARGHEVHMSGPLREGAVTAPPGVTLHVENRHGVKLAYLPRLVAIQRAIRADIIHFHNALPRGEIVQGMRALRRLIGNPRLVVTPHTSARANYPKRRARQGLRLADHVIAVSQWSADHAVAAGADPARVDVVHNGIDRVADRPAALVAPNIIALGRLKHVKGFDLLIQAFDQIAERQPGWRLRIAGEGSEDAALRELAAKTKASDRIDFVGQIGGQAKRDFLANASIGAVPSRLESFGGVLLELHAEGLPCIASDVGGLPEIGAAGTILVPGEDIAALARALERLIEEPSLRSRLGEDARQSASQQTWANVAERYENLYRHYLSR